MNENTEELEIKDLSSYEDLYKVKPSRIKKRKPSRKKKSKKNDTLSFFVEIIVCILVAFLLSNFVIRPVQVKGNSMYPTLKDESLGFSNILGRNISEIQRFDIVIVYLAEKDEYLVKRVIGLPGETVFYEDGQLYINGEAVEEDFLDEEYVRSYGSNFMSDVSAVTLGENQYYVLGDNRPHSSDSRVYGAFSSKDILSKGIFIFFPFSNFGVETW